MNPLFLLELLVNWLVFSVLGLAQGSLAGEALSFFLYDSAKIFILLIVIIYAVSILRTYVPPERIKRILSRRGRLADHVSASLLGVITPFCTCSAIPLFLGFVEAGVPLGVTFSFLVASPMINEVALVLLLGLFGWKIALLYLASGLFIAIIAGIVIGALKPELLLVNLNKKKAKRERLETWAWSDRTEYAKRYTVSILKKVWLYILIGVGLGALIHGYVPADFLAAYAGADKWYAVPFAVLLGIPLYSNAAGIIPLVSVLTEKGVAMGTVLAFMMAVTGLSLPEFLILRRVMKTRLILLFAVTVGVGIILTGYLFNAALG